MNYFDPTGVNTRKRGTLWCKLYYSQGLNWAWNSEGYDNLKPNNFKINGCIDGHSKHVLWLSVIQSNKGPKEVCIIYFNYLLIAKGVPQKL